MDQRTDPRLAGAQLIIDGEHLIFRRFADPDDDILDGDVEEITTETMLLTRRGKSYVENGIFAYARLRDLPQLRELHNRHKHLDIPRLNAIDRTLNVLPADTSEEVWQTIDAMLSDMLSPTHPTRPLPTIWAITRRLRRLIATIDASVNFDPVARKKRSIPTATQASIYPININGQPLGELTLTTNNATMAGIRAHLTATARHHKLSLPDAIIKLLAGDITPAVQPVIYLYTPTTPGQTPHIPGFGPATADDLETLHRIYDASPPRTINLDAASEAHTDAYRPTDAMAAYIHARNPTCIYPDCHQPAHRCQLDHRIPHDQGGPTTPANLYPLCQHHHNTKTDKRAFYIPDPHTGDIIWLFPNGTWTTAATDSIIRHHTTPTNPRWAVSLAQERHERATVERFHAACHTLCDTYDETGDLEECLTGIRALEREYGLTFDFAPQPDTSWLPPEPDPHEPPYPDPLDTTADEPLANAM
ncbi:HNH endonuclease signature motif containing protein [Corynebacterium senegalense]|uniref:HNH endonuclease signature motif containing protein n=1 Tax=Corynebacterium senegalense TaxID=2080750 RepID=UPI000E2012D7|nr:HNH endonuclease signature motif containing protein [Corynebacterium senegalense]